MYRLIKQGRDLTSLLMGDWNLQVWRQKFDDVGLYEPVEMHLSVWNTDISITWPANHIIVSVLGRHKPNLSNGITCIVIGSGVHGKQAWQSKSRKYFNTFVSHCTCYLEQIWIASFLSSWNLEATFPLNHLSYSCGSYTIEKYLKYPF